MHTTGTLTNLAERRALFRRDFQAGLLVATTAIFLVCAIALPRFAELEAFGDTVVTGGVAVAVTGFLLGGFKRTRAAGLGMLTGAVLGLTLCGALVILYVGMLMR